MLYLIESSDRRSDALFSLISKESFAVRFLPGSNLSEVAGSEPSAFGKTAIIFPPVKKLSMAEANGLLKGSIVFGGGQSEDVLNAVKLRECTYVDLMQNSVFAIKNAGLVAEGVLSLLINYSEKSLLKTDICLLGLGRVGKAVSLLLNRVGLDITLGTFSRLEYENSALYAEKCYFDEDVLPQLSSFDIIINTLPIGITKSLALDTVPPTTVILDIAGSIEKTPTMHHVSCSNLAAKFSPLAAAEAMLEAINQNISNL